MQYLVLRRRAATSGEAGLESMTPVGAGGEIEAIFQDLPPSEIRGLQRDQNVLCGTEPMPVKLIEPVKSESFEPSTSTTSSDQDAEPQTTWGVRAVGADKSEFDGRGVRVAVLDTGIDPGHNAFSGVNIIGRNYTWNSDVDTTIDPDNFHDPYGHGTHCAGTIVGRDVNGQRIGIARGVEALIVAKVLGPGGGSTGTLFEAMNWAISQGAQILSMSLSMDLVGLRERLAGQGIHQKEATSKAMRLLIDNVRFFDKFANLLRSDNAFGRGAVVIAASGNQSDRLGHRFQGAPFVLGANYPGNSEDFVSVGAVELTGDESEPYRIAEFSNANTKLVGPGVKVLSAKVGSTSDALRFDDGTSMATPHVAGVAALWAQKLAQDGRMTPQRVTQALLNSGSRSAGLHGDDVGDGIPSAP